MAAQEQNVNVISNNIANMRTTGYKRQRAEFQDLLYQEYRRAGSTTSDSGTQVPVGVEIGSGVKIANVGAPGPLRESVQTAYQNLQSRNRELIGDRDAKQHELTIQVRAMDVAREGSNLGVPILLAFCSALLAKSLRGGTVIIGGMSIGGSFEPIHNAVSVAELAVEKGAQTILFPVSARRQLNDLSDEMAAKITIVYFTDVRDALLKSIAE